MFLPSIQTLVLTWLLAPMASRPREKTVFGLVAKACKNRDLGSMPKVAGEKGLYRWGSAPMRGLHIACRAYPLGMPCRRMSKLCAALS